MLLVHLLVHSLRQHAHGVPCGDVRLTAATAVVKCVNGIQIFRRWRLDR